MGLRPNSSESGPHISGPTQYPAMNIAIVNVATSVPKPNCSMSCVTMPSGADDANVLSYMLDDTRSLNKGRRHVRIQQQEGRSHRDIPAVYPGPRFRIVWVLGPHCDFERVVRLLTWRGTIRLVLELGVDVFLLILLRVNGD